MKDFVPVPVPVHVIVTVSPREGETMTVISAFLASQKRLKTNCDCLQFEVYEHASVPMTVIVLEVWTSLRAHQRELTEVMASPAFSEFREKLSKDLSFLYLSEMDGRK